MQTFSQGFKEDIVKKMFVLLGLGLIILASSCHTLNVGGHNFPQRFSITGITLSPAEPAAGYVAGTTVTATITFQGVTAPFNFTVTFDNGVTPATQNIVGVAGTNGTGTATATFTIDPFLLTDVPAGKTIKVHVTGTDGAGSSGSADATFKVTGIPNQNPTISTSFDATTDDVTATVGDPDGDSVTVTAGTATGISTGAAQTVAGTAGTPTAGSVTFHFNADDLFNGGAGDVTFTADDGNGGTATSTVHVTIDPFVLDPDTLYAVPLQTSVAAGDPVTVVVATGVPANPFQYLTGVRVTAPQASGFAYVANSFNAGAVGGATGDVDGFWTCMGPTSFLLPQDAFIVRSDAGGGLYGIDFNVTPLGGQDVTTCDGALFNFQASFTTPGTYNLGFQDVNVVSRTYYQDGSQTPDRFWGDITNAASPAITVN